VSEVKGLAWLATYFMGYYTIWLATVKKYLFPFWEFGKKTDSTEKFKTRSIKTQGCGTQRPFC
jgi:hypothetical protein